MAVLNSFPDSSQPLSVPREALRMTLLFVCLKDLVALVV